MGGRPAGWNDGMLIQEDEERPIDALKESESSGPATSGIWLCVCAESVRINNRLVEQVILW